jgi:hypothetical protein
MVYILNMSEEKKPDQLVRDESKDPSFQFIEETSIEVTVYNNVIKWLNFHNIELFEGHDDDEKTIHKKLSIQNFLMIKGLSDKSTEYIFIFGQQSTSEGKNAFGSRADDIASIMKIVKEDVANITLVSEHIPKSNVTKAIKRHQDKENIRYTVQNIIHSVFLVNHLENSVFRGRILPPDEANELKAMFEKNNAMFASVWASKPLVIWLKGKPRQIVEYTLPSILTRDTVYYRVIKRY